MALLVLSSLFLRKLKFWVFEPHPSLDPTPRVAQQVNRTKTPRLVFCLQISWFAHQHHTAYLPSPSTPHRTLHGSVMLLFSMPSSEKTLMENSKHIWVFTLSWMNLKFPREALMSFLCAVPPNYSRLDAGCKAVQICRSSRTSKCLWISEWVPCLATPSPPTGAPELNSVHLV